jgi:hypothetical protein
MGFSERQFYESNRCAKVICDVRCPDCRLKESPPRNCFCAGDGRIQYQFFPDVPSYVSIVLAGLERMY